MVIGTFTISFWELELFLNFSYFENLSASTLDAAAH